MKKYILEYGTHDEAIALLGREIPHEHLEHVKTIILDLFDDEYIAIKEAGYTIFENVYEDLDPLAFPANLPSYRSYPTSPNYINDYLKIPQARTAGFDGSGVSVALLGTGCLDASLPFASASIIRLDFSGVGLDYDPYNHDSKGCVIGTQRKSFFSTLAVTEGIAQGCQLYSMSCFYGGSAAYIAGINYAIANNIDIISTSIRGLGTTIDTAIAAAIEAGIIVVCAAGNTLGDTIVEHGLIPGSITVNGVPYNNALVPFGSYLTDNGHVGITVTFHAEGHYEFRTGGTSQTSFHIAFLMAIYKQKYPSLTSKQAVHLLKRRALKMDTFTYDKVSSTKTRGVKEDYKTGAGFVAPLY